MVTEKARAYYSLVSRLRRAGLSFSSLVPGADVAGCGIVLTTMEEATVYGGMVVCLEDLDDSPEVFKGQLFSKADGGSQPLRVGIDPGVRTGVAVFYGDARLATRTFHSIPAASLWVDSFSRGIVNSQVLVRIGNGDRPRAESIAESIQRTLSHATVELVDESGTSTRTRGMKGMQLDQSSASRIAFRKGMVASRRPPRTPG